MPRRALELLLCLFPVAMAVAHGRHYWVDTAGDMGVTIGYARTLAEHGVLSLWPGAAQTQGFFSPLWVLILSLCHHLGLDMAAMAKLLGLLSGAAGILLLPGLGRSLRGGGRSLAAADLFAPSLLALNPTLARGLVNGQENGLVLLLLVLSLRLFVAEERRAERGDIGHGDLGSLGPLALLMVSRPDGPLLLLAFYLWRLQARVSAWRPPAWSTAAWLTLLPLLLGLTLTAGYLLFADLVPGIISARDALPEQRMGHPLALAQGLEVLAGIPGRWGLTVPLAAVALLGALAVRNYWGKTLPLALMCLGAASVVLLGAPWQVRVPLPLLLGLAVSAGSGVAGLTALLRQASGRPWSLFASVALGLGLLAAPSAAMMKHLSRPVLSEYDRQRKLMGRLLMVMEELGWQPRQVSVLTNEPGAAAQEGFRVMDSTGVTDPSIRRYNGNRRPLEMQQLIFSDRRPDVIIESGIWRRVHAFTEYPLATRRYIQVDVPGRPGLAMRVSRDLVLENEPWPDMALRVDLGHGLELLGLRIRPGRAVLLWTASQKIHRPRTVRLALGHGWQATLKVGPSIYPASRWRPGEMVRQVVRLPQLRRDRQTPLRLYTDKLGWTELGKVDTSPLHMDMAEYFAWRLGPQLRRNDHEQAELMTYLTRQSTDLPPEIARRIRRRVEDLHRRGHNALAISQLLTLWPRGMEPPASLRPLARALADEAYQQALGDIRNSRWTSAFSTLQAASRAEPTSAWISRRLEEGRRRMPAESELVQELELELARRAMVLAPTPEHLRRVLSALLSLGRHQEAVVAARTWQQRVGRDRQVYYLVAKALSKLGRLQRALAMTEGLLAQVPTHTLRRRCPQGLYAQLSLLRAELLAQLGRPPSADSPRAHFSGKGYPVGRHSEVFAYCTSWSPGRLLTVDLYIHQDQPEEIDLTLSGGSRVERLVLEGSRQQVRLVRKKFLLPPARYPLRLRSETAPPMDLGTLEVGPESGFGFEFPNYVGWKEEGTAFGQTPVHARSFRHRQMFGYVGERFADSFVKNTDWHTGTLTSPPFRITHTYLMLLVSGGRSGRLGVDLHVGKKVVYTIFGHRSEVMRLHFIPVRRYRGRWAQVVIRDKEKGPWGHIAVDEIRQIDGPLPWLAP